MPEPQSDYVDTKLTISGSVMCPLSKYMRIVYFTPTETWLPQLNAIATKATVAG